MKKNRVKENVYTAFFMMFIIVMALTPLGFIQLGVLKVTLIHIPVILGSLLLGYKKGAFLGFVFGCMSILTNTLTPNPVSFVFSPFIPLPGSAHGSSLALLVALVPRILVGLIPGLLYQKTQKISLVSVIASFVNTVGVLGLIVVLFGQAYSSALGQSISALYSMLLGVIFTNGLAEAVLAGIFVKAVFSRLQKSMH